MLRSIHERLREARADLIHREEIRDRGVGDRRLAHELKSGIWHRVRRGWYVEGVRWRVLRTEERHLRQVLAAQASARRPLAFTHYSAAVLHGLPLFHMPPSRVHTWTPELRKSPSTPEVHRHVMQLEPSDLCEINGLWLTTIDRTVIDVARCASPALAIGCADAALQRFSRDPGEQTAWRDRLIERLDESPGARGNATARYVLQIAEGTADSVLESVSRLFLVNSGFEVRSQVEIGAPHGPSYRVDFEFVGMGVIGEVDGLVKYRDPDLLGGRSNEDVVIAEKRREDYIRGITGKRIVRWEAAHLTSADALRQRLAMFGVVTPLSRVRKHRVRA